MWYHIIKETITRLWCQHTNPFLRMEFEPGLVRNKTQWTQLLVHACAFRKQQPAAKDDLQRCCSIQGRPFQPNINHWILLASGLMSCTVCSQRSTNLDPPTHTHAQTALQLFLVGERERERRWEGTHFPPWGFGWSSPSTLSASPHTPTIPDTSQVAVCVM